MTETQTFITEVINLVPQDSICFIQAPSIESLTYLELVTASSFDYYKQIILTGSNKRLLGKVIADENIEEFFQSIQIRFNDKLLFEGYDGMEYGIISKTLPLTDFFKKNLIDKKLCVVSEEW
jgi:hypothetical protein